MIDILQLKGGQDLLSDVAAAKEAADHLYYSVQDTFTATAGQTSFTLSQIPNDRPIVLGVNGLDYYENVSFTANRSSKTITWADTNYTLEAGDSVSILYFVSSNALAGQGIAFNVQSGNLTVTINGTTYTLMTSAAAPTAGSMLLTGFASGSSTAPLATTDSVNEALAKLQNRIAILESEAVRVESD